MKNQFWETYVKACKERKTSPSAVAKALGLSSGSPTAWKRGASPNIDTIFRISDYLDWPYQEFIGISEDLENWLEGYEKKQKERSRPENLDKNAIKFALFGSDEIDDAKLNEVLRYAAYVRDL